MNENLQQGLLGGVLRLLLILQDTERRYIHSPFIGLNEVVKSLCIARDYPLDEGSFASTHLWRRFVRDGLDGPSLAEYCVCQQSISKVADQMRGRHRFHPIGV